MFNLYAINPDESQSLLGSYESLSDAQIVMNSFNNGIFHSIEQIDQHSNCSIVASDDPNSPLNNLGIPNSPTTLQILEAKANFYINFGKKIFAKISAEVWAMNVLRNSQGQTMTPQQMLTLLNASNSLKQSLESGSLQTSLYVISQLVAAFPQYADIGASATTSINNYMSGS